MGNEEKVFTDLETEVVQILSELCMDPKSHRDFEWIKEVILMAVRNPLTREAQWTEHIGKRENITRERVRQILHKAVWSHWTFDSKNILEKNFGMIEVKFEYAKPNHIEFIKLISDILRKKYQVLS